MKLALALEAFKADLERYYGIKDPLISIDLDRRIMPQIRSEMDELTRYTSGNFGSFKVGGIEIVPITGQKEAPSF